MSMYKVDGFPRTLNWNDFTSKNKAPKVGFVALTISSFKQTSVEIAKNEDGDQYVCTKITLKVLIYKTDSWVLKSAKSKNLLKHEQGHFDITGLAAQQAVYEIEYASSDSAAGLNHEITGIYKRAQKTIKEMNKNYESDTENGTNESKQKEWDARFVKWKKEGLSWYGS